MKINEMIRKRKGGPKGCVRAKRAKCVARIWRRVRAKRGQPPNEREHFARFASAHPDGGPLRFPQFVATGNPLQISAALEHAQ